MNAKIKRLQEISDKLDLLESTGEWIARAFVHKDPTTSSGGSLLITLAEDLRLELNHLVHDLESEIHMYSEAVTLN